jgi:class 3 adenylate cyclase
LQLAMSFREFHFRWAFDFQSSPEKIWPFVADTNRFNRDTGVPKLEIDAPATQTTNARRRVRFSIYGMPIEWEEQPFEWVKPVRFGVERIYNKGPMARMRALAELTPSATGGTKLTYDLWATPRNLIGMIAIPAQIRLITAPRFRAAFKRYDKLASTEVVRPDTNASPSPLPEIDLSRLAALKQKLLSSLSDKSSAERVGIVEKLVTFIEFEDDFAVARFRPYELADRWGESRRKVLETCLLATRAGLLDLQWDIVCPLCRGAKETNASLKEIATSVHCSTCQIDFTVNFDRFVELTFRPNAAIRRVDVAEFCIGSPERSPHVVAQQLLKAGENRKVTLPLEPGDYRLRALELPGSVTLTVSAEGRKTAQVVALDHGWSEQFLNIAERSDLALENATEAEQLLILERTAWSDQAATAAEVTTLQMFRDLFSSEALRPGEQISVGTLTVLFTDLKNSTRLYREIGDATAFGRVMNHFDVLTKSITEHDGAIVKTIGDAVMAVFRQPGSALMAVLQAQRALANPSEGTMPLLLKAGIHSGPCIAVTLNERLDYFGSTVNLAARLEGLSSGADVIISRAIYDDPEFATLLESQKVDVVPFDISVKGFDDERFELWRVTRRD